VNSSGRKRVTSRRTKSIFLVATVLALFGFSVFIWIFSHANWLFPSKAVRDLEDWALASFLLGVTGELAAMFSWISDNVVRKQRPWWTQ
jgi:hypothetical protein